MLLVRPMFAGLFLTLAVSFLVSADVAVRSLGLVLLVVDEHVFFSDVSAVICLDMPSVELLPISRGFRLDLLGLVVGIFHLLLRMTQV